MNIEINGPATIIMILNMLLEDGKIDKEYHDILVNHALTTIEYIKTLKNADNVQWHEVKSSMDKKGL